MKKVAVSGGFDPLHLGHLQMFEEAKKLGDYLVVILNGDSWLRRKKGYAFMPALQRAAIIGALECVDEVYIYESETRDDVCEAIEKLHPDIFANGGDRKHDNVPEVEVCDRLNIQMQFNVGGGKIESSSELIRRAAPLAHFEKRPWGHMYTYRNEGGWWVKSLHVDPEARLSKQSHAMRAETWTCVEGTLFAEINDEIHEMHPGDTISFGKGVIHRLRGGLEGGTIIEVAYGDEMREDDITRYEDDYNRV